MDILAHVIWFGMSFLAVWQSVEICHHSRVGGAWRRIAERLKAGRMTRSFGDGMACPYCYSNWFGMLYMGCYAFYRFDLLSAAVVTFLGGLASARLANLFNDILHDKCRTPNLNPISNSALVAANADIPLAFVDESETINQENKND